MKGLILEHISQLILLYFIIFSEVNDMFVLKYQNLLLIIRYQT
jgi:hypothetical protein